MKKLVLLVLLLFPALTLAQIPSGYVQATATVPILANGYFGAAWTNLSSSPQLGLLGCVSTFQTTVNGTIDSYGKFSVLLADPGQICPSPSTWTFTFTCFTPPGAFITPITVTGGGSIDDISAQIIAAAPTNICQGGSGGRQLTVETNGAPNFSQTLLNFTDTPTIKFLNPSGGIESANCTTATSSLLGCSRPDNTTIVVNSGVLSSLVSPVDFQHNDTNLTGLFTANPQILDFNDTTPAAPSGFENVTFDPDPTTGRLSAYVPNAALPIVEMNVIPPDTNQGILVWFTHCSAATSNAGLTGPQPCDYRSGAQNTFPGGIFDHNVTANITWDTAVLPAGINPANVTSVTLITFAGFQGTAGQTITCGGTGSATSGFTTPGWLQQNVLIGGGITGANIGGLTCTMQISQSVLGTSGANTMDQIGLWVEYTGAPVASQEAFNIGPWLTYFSQSRELTTNPQWPNGIGGLTAAQIASNYGGAGYTNWIFAVDDLNSPTVGGPCTGGGSTIGLCVSNGSSFTVWGLTGGGGDAITSPGATINVGGTSTATTLDVNTAHAYTWTAAHTFSLGLTIASGHSLTNTGVSDGCATWATGVLGSTGSACGSGGSFPTGTTGGVAYYNGSAGAISSDVVVDQGGIPVQISGSGASQLDLTYNSTPVVPGSSTTAVYGVNSSGQAVASEAGGSAARVCTASNGVCSAGGGGYTNLVASATSDTTVAIINGKCTTGQAYLLSTAATLTAGGTLNCPVVHTAGGQWSAGSAITVTLAGGFTELPNQGPSKAFGTNISPVFPTTQAVIHAAWCGDVADYNGTTGTDDTSAIQTCKNGMSNGKLMLQLGGHKISSAITNSTSNVTIEGPDVGGGVPQINSLTAANKAFLAQVTSGADGIDISNCTACGVRNLDVYDHNIASGTSNGISMSSIVSPILRNINVSDFINDFNLGAMGGSGQSEIQNLLGVYGYFGAGGPTYGTVNLCSFNFSSSGGYASTYMYGLLGGLNNGVHGTSTAAAFCLSGTNVSDLNISKDEAASALDYGWLVTTSATGFSAYDINIYDTVIDSMTISCIKTVNFVGSQLTFSRGTCNATATSQKGIDIEGSGAGTSGAITLAGWKFKNGAASSVTGIYVNASSWVTIDNPITDPGTAFTGTAIALNNSDRVTITGGNLSVAGSNTDVVLTGSSVNITGLSLDHNGAGGTGVSLDNASSNSLVSVTCDLSNITTCVSNGTGSNITYISNQSNNIGSSPAFSAITGGTNTAAAMVVGSGASLAPTGTGTIQATNIASTISAGTNVTITGSGTPASPYNISSSGGGGGGSAFPFTILQSGVQTYGAASGSFTYTFPSALQASGATAMLIIAADASGSFTAPSGWTCTINVSSGTNFPRLVVCIKASASDTTASFSLANTAEPSVRFYEFSGTHTFDVTSGTGYASGAPTTLVPPSITATSGAAIFFAATGVNPNAGGPVMYPMGQPNWTDAQMWSPSTNGRVLVGGVYQQASTGAAVNPPPVNLLFSALSASGIAYATWSIK